VETVHSKEAERGNCT